MAIQNRRGSYTKFNPSKMVEGEFAIVKDSDPSGPEGKAAYIAFGPGDVQRLTTDKDLEGISNDFEALKNEVDGATDGKVDGGYTENGYLYLTSNGKVVVGPLGPFSSSGGGTGGSSGNNATFAMSNETGWLTTTIASGNSCPVKIKWSSVEDGTQTGNGIMKITVGGSVKATRNVEQGNIEEDLSPYLSAGSNSVIINISDAYGNNRNLIFTIQVVQISVSSPFDATTPYTGSIFFAYTPVGSVEKHVHFILDGNEIGTVTTSVSGRQLSYTIPQQSYGAHTFECYFDCEINGQTVESNKLHYEIMCIETSSSSPIITTSFTDTSVPQYSTIQLKYQVYDPAGLTASVTIEANSTEIASLTVDRTEQTLSYRCDTAGSMEIKITSGETSKTISFTVTESKIEVLAETEGLSLDLSSYGRSNSEENPDVWAYGDISTQFSGFNHSSDGWKNDEDGITELKIARGRQVYVPYLLFGSDLRSTGKTVELEFSTEDVLDYDTPIITCMDGGRGISITPQMIRLASEQSEISMPYKENEHVRATFAIQPRSENRLMMIYANGVMSGAVQYPDSDDFSQASPVGITIGSDKCTVNVYHVRIYDNCLTREQILTNWIADTQDLTQLLARYNRNNVYDEYGNIVISKLPEGLPYMIVECPEWPQYKGDKKTASITYVDPSDASKSFTATGVQIDVQGTSSQYYPVKNIKQKYKKGFEMTESGKHADDYAMSSNAIPTDVFTMKADVASSEGANNTELVDFYNATCPYKTPAQIADSRVRQGIEGHPMVMFWDNGEKTEFVGKYNFNNDKSTAEVYGFTTGDESWEISNNTSNRVLWKSDDFTSLIDDGNGNKILAWLNDFEARYPDTDPAYTDSTQLQAFASWVKSTDTTQATGEALSAPVTYGSGDSAATYTVDSAEYRLSKFKNELGNYAAVESAEFYYLFTELFLMVDSRAKNAFPSFIGDTGTGTIKKLVVWLPYDMDTALGINNEGALVFVYYLEDIDQTESGADVYNGQQSVFWKNMRSCFFAEMKAMYQNLRSTGAWTFEKIRKRFDDHQRAWGEAIFNEDAYVKYLAPLINNNDGSVLAMLLGTKELQRDWFTYNRLQYLDSKYNAGDSLSNVIQLRGYAKANVKVTPYANIYITVKYGSYLTQVRADRNKEYEIECPLDNVNDTEIYIYSAPQLASVGDLSGLMVGYADFSKATKLQEIKIGNSADSYSNGNMKELYLGNNKLLKTIDVRNCVGLGQGDMKSVDLSGCSNIEEAYFDGTNVTAVILPNGGILKILHLPATVTNLTIRNQPSITDLDIPTYENISTLWLENNGSAVDSKAILQAIPESSRVRIVGFTWEADDADEITGIFDRLDKMRGLDESGNNMDTAQVSGTIHTDSLTGTQIADFNDRYPYVTVTADHTTSYLYYYNYDGSQLLYTETIKDGGDGTYTGTPSRAADSYATYTFSGWSTTKNATSASSTATKNVVADRSVYAAYTSTGKTYTVYFYNGSTLLQTVSVFAGGTAYYSGDTPVYTGDNADDWQFSGWSPSNSNILANTSCYAQYNYIGIEETITDTWEEILAAEADGTYKTKYKVGDTKKIDLGTEGIVAMQIVGFDKDDLADGSGKAPISWISVQLLKTSHRMNPYRVDNFKWASGKGWGNYGNASSTTSDFYINNSSNVPAAGETATWICTFTAAADFKIQVSSQPINSTGSGLAEDYEYTANVNGTDIYKNVGGMVSVPAGTEVSVSSGDTVTITLTFKQDSAATLSAYRYLSAYLKFTNSSNVQTSFATVTGGTSNATITISDNQVRTLDSYTEGTGSIGGWAKTEMRAYLKETIKPLIPETVRNAIREVSKPYDLYNTAGSYSSQSNQSITDDVWLPSYSEMFGSSSLYYDQFQNTNANRIKKKAGASSASWWWLRSAYNGSSFSCVNGSGGYNGNSANGSSALPLGFCT